MLNNQLDKTDQDILNELIKNARKSYSQVARDLGISNSLVHQRINKLSEAGIIKGTQVILDEKLLGYRTAAFTGIALKEAKGSYQVARELRKIPEVSECHFISGTFALFVKIFAKDNNHLRSVLYDKIHRIKGVASTDTFISFNMDFNRPAPFDQ